MHGKFRGFHLLLSWLMRKVLVFWSLHVKNITIPKEKELGHLISLIMEERMMGGGTVGRAWVSMEEEDSGH